MSMQDDKPGAIPPDWSDAMAGADAEYAAGMLVEGADVHRNLEQALARMQTRPAQPRTAVKRR